MGRPAVESPAPEAAPRRVAPATWLLLGGIVVFGVVIRLISIPYLPAPFPADATYYLDVAKNLATGRGLTIDYVWIYDRGVPDHLPIPSNGYWMPGMCFYLWPWFKLLGSSFLVGQLAGVLLSAPFMMLVWWVGREVTGHEAAGLFAAALAAVDPLFVVASITCDAMLLQGLLMAGSMLLLLKGLERDPKWLLGAGLLGALAHFVRNDGVLILPVALLCAVAVWRAGRSVARPLHALYFLAPYALVIGPWLLRNQLVFGAPSPPQLLRLAFLPHYEAIFRADLSSIRVPEWLAVHHGWVGVLRYDLLVVYRIGEWLVTKGGNSLLLFAVPWLWAHRPATARPFLYLLGVLFLAYCFVIPEVGVWGGITRSFLSFLPLLFAAAAGGVWAGGAWLASGRPHLRALPMTAIVAVLLFAHSFARLGHTLTRVGMEISTSPYVMTQDLLRAFFASHGVPNQPVLVHDPWQFHAVTSLPCLVIPTDGQEAVLSVARRLNARYVVLPGAFRKTYPGLQSALDQGRIAVARAMPTLAAYGGLQIIDLDAERVLADGRRLNEEGMAAARRGDYVPAIARFEAAARLVADYPKPAAGAAGNLALAHFDYGRKLEAEGNLAEARSQYAQAERLAPSDMDTSAIAARRRALEVRR